MIRAAMMSAASRRAPAPAATGDPYWSQVILLAHHDVSGFPDSSTRARAATIKGAPVLGAGRFGAGALQMTAQGQRVAYAATDTAANLPAGDFTIEAWVRFDVASGNTAVRCIASRYSSARGGWVFECSQSGGTLRFFTTWTTSAEGPVVAATGLAWALGQWYHVAVARQGTTYRLFRDGALLATLANETRTIQTNTSTPIEVGGYAWNSTTATHLGLIDDLRITVGTARYTAAFTPPTAAFPDS